jgi:dCMP deaminase
MSSEFVFDWSQLAFGSKKPLRKLQATFITAPRQISNDRFTQLVKAYLPKGPLVLGISTEPYVLGFEDQPQFRMLEQSQVQPIIDKVNVRANTPNIYCLKYSQKDIVHIVRKLGFARVIFINGSWKHSLHTQPVYYAVAEAGVPYHRVSSFVDEAEAKASAKKMEAAVAKRLRLPQTGTFNESEMVDLAAQSARQSFDHTFQTGAAIGKKTGQKYKLLLTAFNEIVPYQTFAMHFGASREIYFSPPNDLNHYDTVHAEVQAIVKAMQQKIDLKDTSLFVNLLPCPVCSRVLLKAGISEVIYEHDHSDGYAVNLLTAAGTQVRRVLG